jgi:16S rRNA (cytosine967-C5)-methyltransferase
LTATLPRRRALAVLRALRRGRLLDRALAQALVGLSARDRAWLHELVYGTVRLRGRLDRRLAAVVHRGLERLEPDVLDVLRLGAYQLLEMDAVPDYAAVSQSVDLARDARGRGAAALVNGALKALDAATDQDVFPRADADPVGYLSTWGSHPHWLVQRWVKRFGPAAARELVDADNRRPALCIRVLGMTAAAAAQQLSTAGIAAWSVEPGDAAVCVEKGTSPVSVLHCVPAVVQDPAASLVPRFAAMPDGPVVDLCSAPGGKALALADEGRRVLALDVSARRLRALRQNAARVGAQLRRLGRSPLRLAVVAGDARRPPLRALVGVLVDAPCTGTGTLRRHPDGKWRLQPSDLESLVRLQREILDGAAEVVAPGGVLVYATCSLEPEENEEQVQAFLERHPDFEEAPPSGPAGLPLDGRGRLVVLPHVHGYDGAFAARLRRVAA